jgi:hypothetical protein
MVLNKTLFVILVSEQRERIQNLSKQIPKYVLNKISLDSGQVGDARRSTRRTIMYISQFVAKVLT